MIRPILTSVMAFALLTSCSKVQLPDLPVVSDIVAAVSATPAMRWDARPEAETWTTRALAAVARHDNALALQVPGDIAAFCPGYEEASIADRRAFWVALMSATAKHESGFNPKAVGGGGKYIGLLQISPRTASAYRCTAKSSSALKDGAANLECAVEIFSGHVGADGMVAGKGNRGMARDWGPMSKKSKRAEIAAWTAKQSYCQG